MNITKEIKNNVLIVKLYADCKKKKITLISVLITNWN